MSPLDLIRGRDGKMVLSKLQAATFHLLLAITVAWITWRKAEFLIEMWLLYAGVAIGHATFDKTAAQIKDFKERKLAKQPDTSPDKLP
jgi:hypothetical protein